MSRPLPPVMSCGEPAGVGPELALKAWRALGTALPFAWIGDPRHLPAGAPVVEIARAADATAAAAQGLPVLVQDFGGAPARPGQPQPAHAAHVIEVIARAVRLVTGGEAGAVVTAPVSKQALAEGAGFAYPGHTEYLAALAGVERVVMMLAAPQLKVVPVTIHIALSEVPRALTAGALEQTLRITAEAMARDFAIAQPRIAVAGLNPHAGEGGRMGTEDQSLIAPVLEKLRAEGFRIAGPLPADTMFHAAARARYDVALAMYHDQALIPVKTLAFDEGVNVTLGLPFVRTSPDHGTAFDIAGQDIASPASLIEALKLAQTMAQARAARSAAGQ